MVPVRYANPTACQARWQVAAQQRPGTRGHLGPSMASVTDHGSSGLTAGFDSVGVVTNDNGDAISAIDYLSHGETWYVAGPNGVVPACDPGASCTPQSGDTGFSPKYNSQEHRRLRLAKSRRDKRVGSAS